MKIPLHRGLLLAAILFGSAHAMNSPPIRTVAAEARAVPPAVPTERILQFENDEVKVWRSVITANAPLTMHRHEHPRVIVALSGGTMIIAEDNGRSESHVWETGKAYWLPANAPNRMHADINKGDKPIEVMVVELKHEK
jgi:hypothetical protein